jgi:xylulokinase
MAGPELAWLHRHEPEVVAPARWALQPKDWIRARLISRFATEPSDASATLIYNVLGQGWDHDVIAALGIRADLLPEILPFSGSVAGHLRPAVAAELALPSSTPVSAGAGDSAAAALGSGVFEPGTVQLSIGTACSSSPSYQHPHRHQSAQHPNRSPTSTVNLHGKWFWLKFRETSRVALDRPRDRSLCRRR